MRRNKNVTEKIDKTIFARRTESAVIVFAIAAAGFWLWSALVSIPDTIAVFSPGFPRLSGRLSSPDLDILAKQLKWQSELSAAAAISAGFSAVAQALAAWARR